MITPKLLCPNCGYQVNDLPVSNGHITCPECGRQDIAITSDSLFTTKDMHKHLVVNSLLATTLPVLLLHIVQHLVPPLGLLFGCLTIPAFPIAFVYLVILAAETTKAQFKSNPRNMRSRNITLLALLYSIPGLILHVIYFKHLFTLIIQTLPTA